MARKSTVARLPKELVEACNGLIREGHTIDEILHALQGLGAQVSRSAVGRYVKGAREELEEYRKTQQVAGQWLDAMHLDESTDVGRLLAEMVKVLAVKTVRGLSASEAGAQPMDVMLLSKAIRDLASTRRTNVDTEMQLRKLREATAMKAAQAAAEVEGMTRQAGMSEELVSSIRARILGVGEPA